MNDALWAGVELKAQYAEFHLDRMGRSLQPPERTGRDAAMQAAGAIIDTGWQQSFYAHFDAFLGAARSVPWIIEAGFGVDTSHSVMRSWFAGLMATERNQRQSFSGQFKPAREIFDKLRLGTARDRSVHRTGFAPANVTIIGRFGVTYTGGPATRVPTAGTRQISDELAYLDTPVAVQPMWTDFTIDGKPLFDECKAYLDAARKLIADARIIAATVHGAVSLTPPPS